MLRRIARDAAGLCAVLALGALVAWPGQWRVGAGVVGGGLLVGLSAWAIRGAVDGWLGGAGGVSGGRRTAAAVLVKFFTRHAILALAAYGMMARLRLDPIAMLVGVTSLVLAAGVEAIRRIQRVS